MFYSWARDRRASSLRIAATNWSVSRQLSKPPGHDGITPRLLKASAPEIAVPLTHLINTSILEAKYPSEWKKGQVTPLLKCRDDDTNKKFYRPVSVLPALNNVYERLLTTQLLSYFKDVLSGFLSAYRKHYSCETGHVVAAGRRLERVLGSRRACCYGVHGPIKSL